MPAPDLRDSIHASLFAFADRPLRTAATGLFRTLGYDSERKLDWSFDTFLDLASKGANPLTEKDTAALEADIASFHLLFQLTDSEIINTSHVDMFESRTSVDTTKIFSYLVIACELKRERYNRTDLARLARLINKPLPMPALVLFKHGDTISLAILHRRLNKRQAEKDVLEKATLIKDIHFVEPIRAHLEILQDFSLSHLAEDFGFHSFVSLHEAWQKRLATYALSNTFYREIADWYFWAHHLIEDETIRLPRHCDTEEEKSLFLIRLLTRLIFCWFLVEKHLLPADLFRTKQLEKLLLDLSPHAPTYYRAVLQNLFFGTLNMPAEQRGFREKAKDGERFDKNRGITNLWRFEKDFRTSADWLPLAKRVPFLNGGLFDCLDDKTGQKTDNFILDGFSDNPKEACHLPNDLFFGPERIVDLSKDYGEEEKRNARSKKAKVRGLIEILSRYKFTIEENTPLEEEIALDPELLGKVFENLLASYNEDTRTTARKALGAFYTPREIVSYMVDESLRSYLATQVPTVTEKTLRDLFSNKATPPEIKPAQRDALVAAIGRVKILDPACGSGAFPMGALHRLVDLLQKLDPNNESWKRDRLAEARRYRELLEGGGASKDEIADCDARIGDIEKSFNTRFHALDFARKLYLIENCIYGVDIQPIATQIAKLRFFISLIVDQKVDPAALNLGVRPLPNLETRLVAADTLIPIEKQSADGQHGDLFSGKIDILRADLARIRHEHFNARDPRKKSKWREADAAKRQELAALLKSEHGMPKDSAHKLATWDPYDQNEHAPFFDTTWMFGIPVGKVRLEGKSPATLRGNLALINETSGQQELVASNVREIDSGFDIVIGNPPYIRLQTLKQKDPKIVAFYKDEYASAAKGNYDIYVIFIEAGLRLLKSNGHLAYICPHKFFNSQYGEPVRRVITDGRHLRHVVHFGDEQVFHGATIYTCLLFLARGGSPDCRYINAHNLEGWKLKQDGLEGRFEAKAIGPSEWNFGVGKGSDVFERLQAMPTKLKQVAARISQGIRTSANEVYVLDLVSEAKSKITATSKHLEEDVGLERKAVRLFLQGREIKPFAILPSSKVVIIPYTLNGRRMELIPFEELSTTTPLLAGYLTRNRKYLQAREDSKMAGSNWYGFVYPKNLNVMLEPKLLVPDIADRACFALDENGDYAFTSGYGITFHDTVKHPLKFMLGLCNSRILDFYWRRVSTPLRGGFFRNFTQFIEQFPVADSTSAQRGAVSLLADYLIYLNQQFATDSTIQNTRDPLMLAYFEQILNGLVYELYFLEEVHGAGLRLFDLVAVAKLPTVDASPEAQRLPRLRQLFEALHDGTHPLKIALQKLQTLDTVRIIEGKA
jgi:adenine-specific DNA-methyltransferase